MKQIYRGLCILCLPVFCLAQGSLLLVGGGGDGSNSWSDQPYGWFVEMADSGKIINIDTETASSDYPVYFKWLGADQTSHEMQIANRTIANDSATYNELISAKGIFIEGGDQWPYVNYWKGTLVEDAIHYVFNNGGAIGGTSAGLAVLGGVVFDAKYGSCYPDEVAYNPYNFKIHFDDDFLEVLPGVLTDSHFHSRGRIGRLVPMLARRIVDWNEPDITGIGITEKTALCLDVNRIGSVYGLGSVSILYKSDQSQINCTPGKPVTFTALHLDHLIHGAVYDLDNKDLVSPGNYLQSVSSTTPPTASFVDTLLNGSISTSAYLGYKYITNLITGLYNAWYGDLGIMPGDSIVPHSIIIPKIWNDSDYYENRLVGGMWGLVLNPTYTTIFLDDNCSTHITGAGMLVPGKLTYVLDSKDMTYAGVLTSRTTNYCGMVGTKLHFLSESDQYNMITRQPITGLSSEQALISDFRLDQNYPNPFNPLTIISYRLPVASYIELAVYNTLGQRVTTLVSETQNAGSYHINWDASDQQSGLYFYRLTAGQRSITRKCILLK